MRSHLISEYPLPEGLSPIPEDVELTPKIILERDLVIKTMLDRFSEARARGEDRNGLDCKAARFSHVDVVDADRQEGDLMDKRWWHGSPLYSRLSEQSAAEIQDYRGINYLDRHNIVKDHLEKYRLAESFGPSSAPSRDLLPIPKAWTATIQGNNRLTPDDHWQDVRKLTMIVHPKLLAKHPVSGDGSELNINGLSSPTTAEDSDKSKSNALSNTPAHSGTQTNSCNEPTNKKLPPANQPQSSHMKFLLKQHTKVEEHEKYELEPLYTSAGDTIMIYPKNFPEDVQALIDIMEWNDIADEPFKHYKERNDGMAIEHAPANCYPVTNSTLRQLLTNNYDITAIPKRSFFDDIRFHAQDLTERERLKEFSEARFIDEFYDYTSRPRRSILEILQDFLSVKIPYQKIPMIFPILRGREYSVASAGVLLVPRDDTEDSTKNTRVELLVAMVKYKTVLRKTRRGLSSRYIESLCPDMKINITSGETRGAPFAELGSIQRPLLAIATGTGLAPVRAAFWERNIEAGHGRNALFFGARNRNADFFFEDEWPMLKVKVYTAFSRDQREKIYVQDVIRREYQVVCELIQERATIMVCGSSGKMPVAVREAVYYAMIKGRLVETDDEAKTYLEDNNEYWEEVW